MQATPAALEVLARLADARGPIVLFVSGGCCDGTHPLCLRADELPPGPGDECLGQLGGVPVFIGEEQYARWGRPAFELDVAPGAADGFSLEGGLGLHFVLVAPARREIRPNP